MSLNNTPSAERLHIGIFGRRNAGKSSVINALTGQDLAIVSDVKGTTTDPVYKAMELLPIGPVVLIDTPGIDDCGELGKMRVQKTHQTLNKVDIALLVVDGTEGMWEKDAQFLKKIREKNIPFLLVQNKADLDIYPVNDEWTVSISAKEKKDIDKLKERIIALIPKDNEEKKIISDKLEPDDTVVMVVPIDASAPKGRIILPQQQTLRDILDAGCSAVVCRDTELSKTLENLSVKPKMVITDSQAFAKVSQIVPDDILLTSFSILFSRYKGNLQQQINAALTLEKINDGDKILISEGCTHHRQCEDIGTVKMPDWIRKYTGKNPEFLFTSGGEFPDDLKDIKLVVHCGGCTLGEREMRYRLKCCEDANVPITNYGTLIAYMNGILERSVRVFPDVYELLK